MGSCAIIGDVQSLEYLSGINALTIASKSGFNFKVIDWLLRSSDLKSTCLHYGIKTVSLTKNEVEETFMLYQQDVVHRVSIAQYGALVFAKNNNTFFTTCDQLTLDIGKRFELKQFCLTDSQIHLLPMYEVHGVDNQKIAAI